MAYSSVFAIAVALAMDAFAVSLAIGAARRDLSPARVFRTAATFGGFQGGMPVLGWFLGSTIIHWISKFDHWLAFVILAAIGIRMIISAFRGLPAFASDPTRGRVLLGLAIATSIDALAAGFSLAMMRVSIWMPVAAIAIVTCALSAIALGLGRTIGARWGRWAEIMGGIVLCTIGVRIVLEHLGGKF